MKKSVAALALLSVAAILTGCSSYRPAPNAFHEAISQPYILDAGDRVRITVFEQDSLSNVYAVDQAGYISFPLIGAVPARGHTLEQIEAYMATRLSDGFLRNPDITREINGEIMTGRVPISDPVLPGDTVFVRERLF